MSIDVEVVSPELTRLGVALGVLTARADGGYDFNAGFFADPVSSLRGVMTDPVRRDAVMTLAVSLLGEATGGEGIPDLPSGQTWIPVAQQGPATLYVVADVTDGGVDIGIAGGADHTQDGVGLAGTVCMALVRLADGEPPALLPGGPHGQVGVRFSIRPPPATATDPVALDAVTGELKLPTDGRAPDFRLAIEGLRLQGWPQPRDLELTGDPAALVEGLAEVASVLLDLVAAAAGLDPASAASLHQVLTLIGLGDADLVPRLRLDDVIERGGAAVREWAESIIGDPTGQRQTAWLRVLARLAGIPEAAIQVIATLSGGLRVRLTPPGDVAAYAHVETATAGGHVTATLGVSAAAAAPALGAGAGAVPVAARVRLDLAHVELAGPPQLSWLPALRVEATFGDAGGPLSSGRVGIRSLHLGLAMDADHQLRPVLEAEGVRVAGGEYPLLDLTSVEAMTQVAGNAASQGLEDLLTPLFGADAAEKAEALLVLLGLRRPPAVTGTWPDLVAVAGFFSDPLGETSRYHARVLGDGKYRQLATAAGVLFGVTGAIPGTGTRDDPWRLSLPPPEPVDVGTVDVLVWGEGGQAAPQLVVAARVVLDPFELDDGTEVRITGLHELARAALPTAPGQQPRLTFCDRHELRLELEATIPPGLGTEDFDDLGDPDDPTAPPDPPGFVPADPRLSLEAGPVTFSCARLDAAVWWERGPGWDGRLQLIDARVEAGELRIDLPDPFGLDWFLTGLDLQAAWPAIRLLLGARFSMPRFVLPDVEWPDIDWPDAELPSLSLPELLAAFLGWLPATRPFRLRLPDGFELELELPDFDGGDWPSLELPALLLDPLGALRLWLGELLAGDLDLSLPAVSLGGVLLGAPEVTGSGTYEDPWAVRLGADPGTPEALLWLDPDGPTLAGLDGVFANVLPGDLLTAPPDAAGLVDILDGAASLDPALRDLLSGRPGIAVALEDLRSRFLAGDGLLAVGDQSAPGDSLSTTPLEATHLDAPARFDLADHSTADPARVVYLCAPLPGVEPWAGQAGGLTIDLRAPARPAESFATSPPATGPWFVLMPTREAAGGHEGVVDRLRVAVGAVTAAAGQAPVVVAHSITAYPARVLHGEGLLAGLVTVSAPAGANPVPDVNGDGVVHDAVRFLQELAARAPTVPEPLGPLLSTIANPLGDAVADPAGVGRVVPFPLTDFVPPPTPAAPGGGTMAVTAVVSRLVAAELDRALAALTNGVVSGVLAALPVGGGGRDPVTHVGFGLRAALAAAPTAGGIDVDASVRLDLHRVRLRAGGEVVRPSPRVLGRIVLRRPGGWLVGETAASAGTGGSAQTSARVRWAEILFDAGADGDSLTSGLVVALHDASLSGVRYGVRRIVLSSLDTVNRALLRELAAAMSPVPASGRLADLVALLRALGVVRVDAAGNVTFDPDVTERLLADPVRYLASLPATEALVAERDAALRVLLGATGTGPLRLELESGFWLAVDVASRTLTAGTEDALVVGETLALTGSVGVALPGADGAPRVSGQLVMAPTDAAEPSERVVVDVSPAGVTAVVAGPGPGSPIALLPVPDQAALARLVASTALGQAVRMALQGTASASAELAAVLRAVGVIDGRGVLQDPVRLFTAPLEWLLRPSALGSATVPGRVSPARVAALLTALAELVDALADDPLGPGAPLALPLPRGGRVTAAADGDDLLVTISLSELAGPADEMAVTAGGRAAMTVRVGPDLVPTVGLAAALRVRAAPGAAVGLAAAELEVATSGAIPGGVRLTLRLWPAQDAPSIVVELFPTPSGLGQLAELVPTAVAEYVLPLLLDELADLGATNPALDDLAQALHGIGDALGLLDDTGAFDIAELRALAQDLPAGLAARFRADPDGVIGALAAAAGLAGGAPTVPGQLWAGLGGRVSVQLSAGTSGAPRLTVVFTGLAPLNGIAVGGRVAASTEGLGPSALTVTAVPPNPAAPDPVELIPGAWPFVGLHLGGVAPGNQPRLEGGLWLDPPETADADALAVRVPFGGDVTVVHRRGETIDDDLAAAFAELVREVVVPLVLDPILRLESVRAAIEDAEIGASTLGEILADAGLLTDQTVGLTRRLVSGVLAEPLPVAVRAVVALLDAALADVPLGPVRLRLDSEGAPGARTRYLLGVQLPSPFALPTVGDVVVSLQAEQSDEPVVELGLVELSGDLTAPEPVLFAPRVRLNGLGFGAAGADGPLLPEGVRVQAVAVYGHYEHAVTGFVEGGARFEIEGLELPIGAGSGGDNPVAGKILQPGDGGAGGPAAGPGPTPGISPYITIQKVGDDPAQVRIGLEGTGWIPIRRSFGPVYIEQIGFDLETDPTAFALLVDGGVLIGPLAAGVDDLTVIIPLASPANPATWRLDLAGLAISFDGQGVTIAGGLRKLRRLGGVEYIGMLDVRAAGYGLTAMGAFGQFPVPGASGGQRYSSLFVIAALAAPLGGPPAFFVLGVGGGIGLNRRLVAPADMTEVPDFPLIAALDPGSQLVRDPMGALTRLGETFPPQPGAFWLAAGVRFTSFTLVESIAVLTVAIGDGLEIMLLGLARAGLPNPRAPAVSLELALCARFSSSEGVLSVQAQLTDNSWLLDRSCRLTGGFAFVIWFRTGEFVVTVGGYHPRYRKSAHQPSVPRVGFAWSVSSVISIKGESYFALTPTCIMTGGRLEAAADFGIVGAWFAAGLDVLVSWDPFFYDLSIYVTVGAWLHIEVKIWFIHISVRITVSIGAELSVTGPQLRGIAKVDLAVTTVVVPFGASDPVAAKEWLGWAAFHDKYLVAGDPTGAAMSVGVTRGVYANDPGAAPPGGGPPADTLRVLPEFAFRTTTRAATDVNNTRFAGPPLGAAPMGRARVTSRHTVTVRPAGAAPGVNVVPNNRLSASPVTGQVPDAVWRMLAPNGEGGMRPAYTGADFVAVVRITGSTGEIPVNQVQQGAPRLLPLLDPRNPGDTLRTATVAAQVWAQSLAGADALAVAAQLMVTPSATLARCLGRGVEAATAAGPSAFEIELLAGERSAPPRLERITTGVYTPARPFQAPDVRERPPPPVPTPPPVPEPVLLGLLRPEATPGRRPRPRTSVGPGERAYPRTHPRTLAAVLAKHRPGATRLFTAAATGVVEIPDRTGTPVQRLVRRGPGGRFRPAGGSVEAVSGLFADDQATSVLARLQGNLRAGTTLSAGDLQVWHVPGAADDWSSARPAVEVRGDQAVRLCVLDLAGDVLADDTVGTGNGTVEVPAGAHRVVVLGTGVPAGTGLGAGLSGWYAGVSVLRVNDYAYVVPGGTLCTPGARTLRARRPVDVALVDPADVVRGRGIAVTLLPPLTACVVVAVRALTPDPDAAELLVGLDRAAELQGTPERVLTVGEDIFVLRTLKPSGLACTVSVGRDQGFALRGVLGSQRPADVVARFLAAEGVAGLIPGLVTSPVTRRPLRSTVTWRAAP